MSEPFTEITGKETRMATTTQLIEATGVKVVTAADFADVEIPVLAGVQRQGDVLVRPAPVTAKTAVPTQGTSVVRGESGATPMPSMPPTDPSTATCPRLRREACASRCCPSRRARPHTWGTPSTATWASAPAATRFVGSGDGRRNPHGRRLGTSPFWVSGLRTRMTERAQTPRRGFTMPGIGGR